MFNAPDCGRALLPDGGMSYKLGFIGLSKYDKIDCMDPGATYSKLLKLLAGNFSGGGRLCSNI